LELFPAGWARATLAAGRLPVSLRHEIQTRSMWWEAGLDRFARWRRRTSSSRHSKGQRRGVKKTLVASRWSTAACSRRIQSPRRRRREIATSPAFASAVLEEEYCARLCSAGTGCGGNCVKVEIRGQGVKRRWYRLRFISVRKRLSHRGARRVTKEKLRAKSQEQEANVISIRRNIQRNMNGSRRRYDRITHTPRLTRDIVFVELPRWRGNHRRQDFGTWNRSSRV